MFIKNQAGGSGGNGTERTKEGCVLFVFFIFFVLILVLYTYGRFNPAGPHGVAGLQSGGAIRSKNQAAVRACNQAGLFQSLYRTAVRYNRARRGRYNRAGAVQQGGAVRYNRAGRAVQQAIRSCIKPLRTNE
jgi:hypothetical protein